MLANSLFGRLPIDYAERFINLGCKKELIEAVVKTKIITDYEPLWQTYRRLPKIFRNNITEPWQLLVLSGEGNAFDYAVNKFNMKKDSRNPAGELPLFYAAMCNNPAQINKALELADKEDQKTLLKSIANNGCNVLHYAILSRNPEQFEKVVKLHLDHEIALSPVANNKRNVLHYAALTGNLEMLNAVIETVKEKICTIETIDQKKLTPIEIIKSEDGDGYNALNYAIKSNNFQVRNRLEKLGLEKGPNQDNFYYGDVETREELAQVEQPKYK